MMEVEPYVLRYWESEFKIKLTKSKNKQRLYQKKDIDQIQRIKTLLYDEKYTIAGAKKKLRERKKRSKNDGQLHLNYTGNTPSAKEFKDLFQKMRNEVEQIQQILNERRSGTA